MSVNTSTDQTVCRRAISELFRMQIAAAPDFVNFALARRIYLLSVKENVVLRQSIVPTPSN